MKTYKLIFACFICLNIPSFAQSNLPEWAKGIVWYQIFPERFANGDSSNDPDASKIFINDADTPPNWKVNDWTGNWFEREEWEKTAGKNFRSSIFNRRYGGDLLGIINHLAYI